MKKKKYTIFIINFYIYQFLKYFAFVYAFYLLWMKQLGLNVFTISIILALWSASVVILEIPSGILADKFSRKWLMVLGCLIHSLGIFIWFLMPNIWGFTIGFFCWGIEEAFSSGSEEALLYDNLAFFKLTTHYEKVAANGRFINKTGLIIALLIGGIMAAWNMKYTTLISAICLSLSAIPAFFLFEFKSDSLEKTDKKEQFAFLFILKTLVKNREMLLLYLFAILVFTGIGVLEEYVQLFFEWKKLPLYFLGIGLSVVFIFQAIGNWLAGFLYQSKLKVLNIYTYSLVSAICLFISLLLQSLYISLVFFLLPFLFTCIAEIIVEGQYQRLISSSQRATFMSLINFSMNVTGIVMSITFGILNKFLNIKGGFFLFVILLLLGSCLGLLKKSDDLSSLY
ncbi:MAG: MFS transporter [Spirochaetes bacterium]|nr:MFS transporter [Spirochaetota bacterium]